MTTKATTAWGEMHLVEEVTLAQRAGKKEFVSAVQLLAGEGGERYIRFAYGTRGAARRGPVTLREEDLARLGGALAEHPELARMLGVVASSPARRWRGS